MPTEQDIRDAFCEIGRRVWQRQFVAANDGNFSYRLDEDRIVCTPTNVSKGFMRPEEMAVVNLAGEQLSGPRRTTSEIRLHLYIYRHRPDVRSVVHVHPPHATAFAVARRALPKGILPEVELFLGEIPMAPYATTGTWDFAATIGPWVANHDAFLLASHGAVTAGADPYDAYYRMETLDQFCRILLLAGQLGGWERLTREEVGELIALKRRAGIADPRPAGNDPRTEECATTTAKEAPAGVYTPDEAPLHDSPKHGTASPWLGGAVPPSESLVREVAAEVVARLTSRKPAS